MRSVVLLCCFLVGCGTWPDAGGPPLERRSANWPELLPLSDVLQTGAVPPVESEEATALSERAASLRNRAAILRVNVPNADAMEAMRNRLR
ncbi:MAG: hypothetical protein AAGF55_10120 [Pseudomonadota bacterium]